RGERGLRESCRGEDGEGARGRVLRDGGDDRQVVAEGLAAGGRRDDHRVWRGMGGLERIGLMRGAGEDPPAAQGRRDAAVEPRGEFRVLSTSRREALPARDHLLEPGVPRERGEEPPAADSCGGSNSRAQDTWTL